MQYNTISRRLIATLIIVGVCIAGYLAVKNYTASRSGTVGETVIRIGWQTAWATQGQVVQALRQENILAQNGLRGDFYGFPAGQPAVEAALTGSLDVISAGSQPILTLVSKSSDWVIVSRHAYVRLGLLVPIESDLKVFPELKGKIIGLPIGSTVERFTLMRAKELGYNPNDFSLRNIGIEEQGEFVRSAGKKSWGEISALGAWEPTVSILERRQVARVIEEENEITLTAMSKKFIREHPEQSVSYLKATMQAWHYYAHHHNELNADYLNEARLQMEENILEDISKNEPNAMVGTLREVDITLTPTIQQRLQKTIDFLVQYGRIARPMNIADIVDNALLGKAKQSLNNHDY